MSPNKPMEEMVRNWTDMQQRMWEHWLQSVKGMQLPSGVDTGQWQQQYQKNLEAWERAVQEALEAQVRWTEKWAQQAGGSGGSSEGMQEALKQTQEMMKTWTEAQSKLWNAWFDSVKNMDPSQMAQQWDTEGQEVLKAWQEATQRAQEALQELSQLATSSAAAGSSGGGSSSGGSTR